MFPSLQRGTLRCMPPYAFDAYEEEQEVLGRDHNT